MLTLFRDDSLGLENILNISIEQNTSFDLTLQLTGDDNITPIDLHGWEVTGSIRRMFDGMVITTFTSSVVNADFGMIRATLSAQQTWILTSPFYQYDIIGNDPTSITYRLVAGKMKILRGVTEP